MTIRSRISSCIVLFVVALAIGFGCATGGDAGGTNPTTCTDPQTACNGACVDLTSDGQNCGACGNVCPAGQGCSAGMCGACVAPQVACGTACVVLGTDNKNCGKCGASCGSNQVCSGGQCTTHCGSGFTTCGGGRDAGADAATSDAAADSSSDATTDATASDATASDASPSDAAADAARDSGGTDAGGVDAGGGPLYCADTQTDPANCGGCGVACSAGHACKGGSCQLDCPTGKHACNASNLCIPDGTCCTSADCTVTGQRCNGPGDTCKCPTGQKLCAASNSCIDQAACCTSADCAGIAGSSCPMAGGMCSCPTGQKACPAAGACIASTACCGNMDCSAVMGETCVGVAPGMGGACQCPAGQRVCPTSASCIPTASCCTAADCTLTSHVTAASCGGGACAVSACSAGYVDVNRTFSDGCECQDSGNPTTCAGSANLGTIALGANTTKTGNLPTTGEENWFNVTFGGQGGTTYHPKIVLTSPGSQFVFDIVSNCTGGAQACGSESGTANFRTTWEVTSGGDPAGVGINTPTYSPTPAVGTNGTVWIRVYRATGNPTCDNYTLTISN